MRAKKNFREWFEGKREIPSSAWYFLACAMAVVYVAGVIASIIINN